MYFKIYIYIYVCIWLHQVLAVACRICSFSMHTFSCGRWHLVPQAGIEPGPPALEALGVEQNLS